MTYVPTQERGNKQKTPELANQIPKYVYPGDVIEILSNEPGDYHGKIHLFYYDDNDFGSFVRGTGPDVGGELIYAALDIEFPDAWIDPSASINNNEIPSITVLGHNYPNPFNPETTISFLTTESTENTELVIYNLKGQKVKTLVNKVLPAGNHSIIWNGKNDNNESVSSGVYFYKMKSGTYISAKKMILLK